MLITEDQEYGQVWDRVYDEFNFQPSTAPNKAFELSVIYDISHLTDEQIDNMYPLITNECDGGTAELFM